MHYSSFYCSISNLIFLPVSNIILMAFVVLLLIMLVSACVTTTKGKKSIDALEEHLTRLQVQLNDHAFIDPESERRKIEVLQNSIKAHCHQSEIASDAGLKAVFRTICQSIIMIFSNQRMDQKASWIKLRELIFSFDNTYFPTHPTLNPRAKPERAEPIKL